MACTLAGKSAHLQYAKNLYSIEYVNNKCIQLTPIVCSNFDQYIAYHIDLILNIDSLFISYLFSCSNHI